MTMVSRQEVDCVCGRSLQFDYHASVNIQVDPLLKSKVMNRKINFFECKACGYSQELIVNFFYHDMDNKVMIKVCPLNEKESIKDSNLPRKLERVIGTLGIRHLTVFGYDELFALLKTFKGN